MPKITGVGYVSIKGAYPTQPVQPVEAPQAGEKKDKPTPPAPQAGVGKWLAYAQDLGIPVPEALRDDKIAIRALVADNE